jgi:type IV fimbrial biogenesis protein FimT
MYSVSHITTDHRSLRRGPGFSLIELVLVMTIIYILAAIAVPKYAGALARYRADAAARRVVTDLDFARQRARASSASITVRMRAQNDIVKVFDVRDPDDANNDNTITRLSNSPYLADVTAVDFGGDNLIVFDGYGAPDSGGTAVVTVGSVSRTIVLDADSGKAVVQ